MLIDDLFSFDFFRYGLSPPPLSMLFIRYAPLDAASVAITRYAERVLMPRVPSPPIRLFIERDVVVNRRSE